MRRETLGWNAFFDEQLEDSERAALIWGRVSEEQRGQYEVMTEAGPVAAILPGRWRRDRAGGLDIPAVGDWVGLEKPAGSEKCVVRRLLKRRTKLSRNAAGEKTQEQVVAANVDVVFVLTSLNMDLSLRRLERFLAVVWDSGAQPVVILTKADLCADPAPLRQQVLTVVGKVPVIVLRRDDAAAVAQISGWIPAGSTAVFIGSSGVGKSTLVNLLAGRELQSTAEVRDDDDKGRHTTTSRKLFALPSGGLVMDTPGMRELQMWDAEFGLAQAFDDIEEIAARCRFSNCAHASEPGCALRAALEAGTLPRERYDSYLKLKTEVAYHSRRTDKASAYSEKHKGQKIHRNQIQNAKKRGQKRS